MSASASTAEQLRAHRLAFELALKLGCTPREAAKILRDQERKRRLTCGTRAPAEQADDFETMDVPARDFRVWDADWMMRD